MGQVAIRRASTDHSAVILRCRSSEVGRLDRPAYTAGRFRPARQPTAV